MSRRKCSREKRNCHRLFSCLQFQIVSRQIVCAVASPYIATVVNMAFPVVVLFHAQSQNMAHSSCYSEQGFLRGTPTCNYVPLNFSKWLDKFYEENLNWAQTRSTILNISSHISTPGVFSRCWRTPPLRITRS